MWNRNRYPIIWGNNRPISPKHVLERRAQHSMEVSPWVKAVRGSIPSSSLPAFTSQSSSHTGSGRRASGPSCSLSLSFSLQFTRELWKGRSGADYHHLLRKKNKKIIMGDDNTWVFDSLVGFLRGPVWNVPILTFIEHKSLSKSFPLSLLSFDV